MATFYNIHKLGDKPTPFGSFDDDSHFQEDADSVILYVKRRLGDDILTVELTSKQSVSLLLVISMWCLRQGI